MRILSVHAHFDDYEFTAAGTFTAFKEKLGDALSARVIVCTDGRAGHHRLSPAETASVRFQEQTASARVGQYDFQQLRLPGGELCREACLLVTRDLLAALWKAIRDFEPDYLFCPPIPADPLAGIHVDHVAVAEAVRKVAYMINVPHAFVEEYPDSESPARPHKVPVILNVYDGYMAGTSRYDLAVNVEPQFLKVCEMAYCHRSQVSEWLPWVGRHDMEAPASFAEWRRTMRRRFDNRNRELGIGAAEATEVFTVTAWGEVPTLEQLLRDIPAILADHSPLGQLGERLRRWRGTG